MRQRAPTTEATPFGGVAQYEQEFVYDDGEKPGWRASSDFSERHASEHVAVVTSTGYMPLTMMQHAMSFKKLNEVRVKVAKLARTDVIQRYRAAYADGKRLVAGVMAAELIERGIPPCFWHETLALDEVSLAQRADLVLADLAWVRHWYPDHAKSIRYQRGKTLITGSEAAFRREAEFAFFEGKRPAWKLVSFMSMTERQQWDCAYLRSTPIKRRWAAVDMLSGRVRKALADDMKAVRRTAAFTSADALATVERRFMLWRCARMVKDGSPTAIAARYHQMTGLSISRQVAANQLDKMRATLRSKGYDFLA